MDIDVITQYIMVIAPAATAIISTVVALIVGIKKIKNAGDSTVDEVKKSNDKIAESNRILHEENLHLKESLNKITAKMEHMYYDDKEE